MTRNETATLEIRSYRGVFDFERRIYRIDRIALSPGGVPVRGILHLLFALAAIAAGSRAPLLGDLLRAIPWTVRWVALPAAVAVLATALKLDGRPLHRAVGPLLRFAVGPRTLAAFRPVSRAGERWRPGDLVTALDGSGPTLPSLTYSGPGVIALRVAHRRSTRPPGLLRRSGLVRLDTIATARPRESGIAMSIGGGVRVEVVPAEEG